MTDPQLSVYPMPTWSNTQEVEDALAEIRSCTDKGSSDAAYHRVLYAVGNDHAGIYYPIAIPVVRRFGEILAKDNVWARRATLDVLMDLSHSFASVREHSTMLLPDGTAADTEIALREAISSLRTTLAQILGGPARGEDEISLASQLLEWIDGK